MSRIYEAIKMRTRIAIQNGFEHARTCLGEMELPDRRVTPRVELDIDLTVYGRSAARSRVL